MTSIAPAIVASINSDEELFTLLGKELERRLPNGRSATDEFVTDLAKLPLGLRAMAATYELDVSLTMDDLGWHFGNWHHLGLAEETARGLSELGATELSDVFRQALWCARKFWDELGQTTWSNWYHGSRLEREIEPLNRKAWALLDGKDAGILSYWVPYARRFPERLVDGPANDA